MKGDKSTKAGYHEPYTVLSPAKRVQSPPNSDSPDGLGACEIYSLESVPASVMATTSPTTWQSGFTPERNE